MRTVVFCLWIVATFCAVNCSAVSATEPPGLREPDQIVFEGAEKIAVNDIQMALRTDFDTILAGHPESSLPGYLRAIEATTLLGYSHSGFSAAKATAEFDEQQQRIVVRVAEGPRHNCSDVRIDGWKQVDGKTLIKVITEPAGRESTPWYQGRPVSFDEATKQRIVDKLKDTFAERGFFSPSLDVQIITEPNSETAALEIAINDEGPRAEIGEITVEGNNRDSEAGILQYLNLRPGQSFHSGLIDRLKTKLTESGRYSSVKINRGPDTQTTDDGREIVSIKIELCEYEQAPPLFEEFTAEEKCLLAFRDWVQRWSRGETEHDIVLELSLSNTAFKEACDELDMPMPPIENADIKIVSVKIVMGPNRGTTVSFWAKDAHDKPIYGQFAVFYPDRLLLGAPLRGTKLTLPQPRGIQTSLISETGLNEKTDDGERPFYCKFGLNCKIGAHRRGALHHFEFAIDAATILSLLRHGDVTCDLQRGVLKLRLGGETPTVCQIEAESGRPILLESKLLEEGSDEPTVRLTIRTEIQAWEREAAQIELQLAAATTYDADSPFRGLLEYACDEALFWMELGGQEPEKLAAVRSLRKLVSRWSPPSLTDLWTPEIAKAFDLDDDEFDNQRFSLPWQPFHWKMADFLKPNSPAGRFVFAPSLSVYRRLVPRDGWLWPVGRDAILDLATESSIPSTSLLNTAKSLAIGPIGELVISSLKDNSTIKSAAAQQDQQLLTADGFRKDYQPLLSGDGWLSKWILSLAEAARSLDEAELRSITDPIMGDDSQVRNIAASFLLMLKEEPEKPVADGLSRMFNVIWNLAGRDMVRNHLEKLAPQSPSQPLVRRPNLNAELIDQQLKFLGLRSAEPTANASSDPKPPGINSSPSAETPAEKDPISIAEQIDRLQKQQKK
ncbi:MAG TPA: POTRA domain-containing protein [Pirellulaceae bacterium]|jgi:hypothetical protein